MRRNKDKESNLRLFECAIKGGSEKIVEGGGFSKKRK